VAAFADDQIEAYVGPRALGAADDLEAEIVRFIDEAEDSVDVAVQELDSAPIAEALIRKRLAGKSVRLVLNHSYLMEEKPPANGGDIVRWATDEAANKVNRDIFAALSRCQVEVRLDFNHAHIFHQKFVVRDLRLRSDGRWDTGGRPALLTGSANFTDTDTHTNLNHVLVFHHGDVAREYGKEFAEIYGGEFGRGRIGDKPTTFSVGGVPVKVLFAPDHAPEAEIIKQLLKCPPGTRSGSRSSPSPGRRESTTPCWSSTAPAERFGGWWIGRSRATTGRRRDGWSRAASRSASPVAGRACASSTTS
jgi:hypothetical protein